MSSQSSGVPLAEKGEVHTEALQQAQPIDLASHRGQAVVQIRPVRSISGIAHGTLSAKQGASGGNAVGSISAVTGTPASIISMSRGNSGPNLTILPARGACHPGGNPTHAQVPTYLARGTIVGNVRTGHQPASITVTPISSSNFGTTGLRLASPINNGTWATIQPGANAQVPFQPIRATTITVNRSVRSDAKMIHIGSPQGGSMQHTQLALVDSKGSVLKPQITTTPIMNVRGNLQGGATGTPLTLPLAPFTIRAANIANLPIQQRPQNPNSSTTNQAKVITQPAHGPPLQLLSTQKLPIHAISQALPRLNTVCLTLSTHGPITSNNTAPVVAMASRQAGTSLVMTPSIGGQVSSGGTLPITKVYPVSRDGAAVMETLIAAPQVSVSGASVNAIPYSTQAANMPQSTVVIASSTPSNSHQVTQGPNTTHHHGHHLVQVHGSLNANSGSGNTVGVGIGLTAQPAVTPSSITQSYYHVDPKNLNVNLVQQYPHNRPVTIEKRTVVSSGEANKGLLAGSTVILTTQNQPPNHHHTQAVTIPIPHSAFSHPISISHQQPHNTIIQSHQILNPASSGASGLSQSHSTNLQIGHHTIPTHVISQPVAVTSNSSVSVTPMTTASVTVSQSVIVTSAHQSNNSVAMSSASSNASSVNATTSSSNPMQTSTPAQSPSQTKSTLSPRPSILRKREAGDYNHHNINPRAQRNLALNFSVTNQSIQVASASAAAAAAAAANKENSVMNTLSLGSIPSQITVTPSPLVPGSMSLLKKEFQPPNEESSWQSCSSNSSSGSTTISTTSETAEIQMQQQQQSLNVASLHDGLSIPAVSMGLSLPGISITSSGSFGPTSCNSNSTPSNSTSQNGIVRSGSTNLSRSKGGNKANTKDAERNKARQEKEDGVSPRKKPRKQQLPPSDLFESASPEISFYQGKRFRKSELMDPKCFEEFSERLSERYTEETALEDAPSPKIAYYLKKPQMKLLSSNQVPGKPPQNHFLRYCDVKSKDERRPTVNDLLNQKNVIQKCNGWKLQHLNNQVEEIIELEGDVVDRFTALLNKLEAKVGPNCTDKDLNRIQELLKGNIQRGKVIRDQMLESKSQVLKILEHKPRVLDVINKYNSKRPIKKRERL